MASLGLWGLSHSLLLSSLQSLLHSEHVPLADALTFTKLGLLPKRVTSYLPLPGKEANIMRVLLRGPHKPPAFVPWGNSSWLFMTITSKEQARSARRPSADSLPPGAAVLWARPAKTEKPTLPWRLPLLLGPHAAHSVHFRIWITTSCPSLLPMLMTLLSMGMRLT